MLLSWQIIRLLWRQAERIHSTSPRPSVPKVLVAAVGQVRAGPTCPVSDSRPEDSGGATYCEVNYPTTTHREKSHSMNLVNWREKKVCIHRSTKFNSFSVSLWRGGAMFAFSYCPSSWSVDSSSDQTETVYWLFKTFTSSDRKYVEHNCWLVTPLILRIKNEQNLA